MAVDELRRDLLRHKVVLVDTPVFCYQFSNESDYIPLTSLVLEAIESGQIAGLATAFTLIEILNAAAQAEDRQVMRDYGLFLVNFPNMRLVRLGVALARETADVRAETGLPTPEAIQVAAARIGGATAIVTHDRRWSTKVTDMDLIALDDYVAV